MGGGWRKAQCVGTVTGGNLGDLFLAADNLLSPFAEGDKHQSRGNHKHRAAASDFIHGS